LAEETFNPNAYIPSMKNMKSGLKARTLILNSLTKSPLQLKDLRLKTGLTSSSINYHLKILEKHRLIRKKHVSKRKVVVEQTGLGQKLIKNFT